MRGDERERPFLRRWTSSRRRGGAVAWLGAYLVFISVSCTASEGNGDEGELHFTTYQCGVGVSSLRRDVAPTSCEVDTTVLIPLPAGCEREFHSAKATIRRATCNRGPCAAIGAKVGASDIIFVAPFRGSVEVVAEVDGEELSDTKAIDVSCVPRLPLPAPPTVTDASAPKYCRSDAPFAPPRLVPGLEGYAAAHPSLSFRENVITFDMDNGAGDSAVYWLSRGSTAEPFGGVPRSSSPAADAGPGRDREPRPPESWVGSWLTPLPFFFTSDRTGKSTIWVRWSDNYLGPVSGVTSSGEEGQPLAESHYLWFGSDRSGDWEIYRADTRVDPTQALDVLRVDELGSSSFDGYPVLAMGGGTVGPGNTIFFASDRGGELSVWRAARPSTAGKFDPPASVTELHEPGSEEMPGWLSPDECRLFFTRKTDGVTRIYVAER